MRVMNFEDYEKTKRGTNNNKQQHVSLMEFFMQTSFQTSIISVVLSLHFLLDHAGYIGILLKSW